MNGKFRFGIIFTIALVLALLMFPLSAFLTDSSANATIPYPYLSATITSPANGITIQEGQCFTVTAQVNVTCPGAADSSWPARPVYAVPLSYGATNVAATISFSGNAALASGQVAVPSLGTVNCAGQATASWLVCCTGKGTAVITVTPSGYALLITQRPGNPWDRMVKPVYANAVPQSIPAEYITSASVTVIQVASKLRSDDSATGGSGAGQQTWAMPADTKVTTAFVQTDQVLVGQPVRIMANISNKGDLPGSYTATLMINNQVESTKKVTVPGNAAIPVEFTVIRDKPGNYEADINGYKVYFTVKGQASSSPVDARVIVFVVIGVLIVTAVVLLIRYLAARNA